MAVIITFPKKLKAELVKFRRQSDRLMLETYWYPVVVSCVLIGAISAFTKALL